MSLVTSHPFVSPVTLALSTLTNLNFSIKVTIVKEKKFGSNLLLKLAMVTIQWEDMVLEDSVQALMQLLAILMVEDELEWDTEVDLGEVECSLQLLLVLEVGYY